MGTMSNLKLRYRLAFQLALVTIPPVNYFCAIVGAPEMVVTELLLNH